jgi:hypothetical protein
MSASTNQEGASDGALLHSYMQKETVDRVLITIVLRCLT